MERANKDLIRKCIKRDRRAQYEFFKSYYGLFYTVCSRYARNDDRIRELVNIGFAKVMLNLKKYDAKKPFDKWAKSIVINTAIDEFRKSKTYRNHVQTVDHDSVINNNLEAADFTLSTELNEVVQLKLNELPELTKNVFNLYVIDGYKHREISEMLQIPEGTSHFHYSEAKKTLREFLKNNYAITG